MPHEELTGAFPLWKCFQLYTSNKQEIKRQHFFESNMLEMWKQNAIPKGALTFRLIQCIIISLICIEVMIPLAFCE